ncbi:MAG: outer membrane protein OmpA-like peptidoglycan-associated protein [Litorivivens sp.]|jgi:outer membrane protein OmpA-like peptidoglycan-associated protein
MLQRILTFGCLFLCTLMAQGQSVTVINNYGDTTGMGPDQAFQLRETQRHTVVINYYESADTAQVERLTLLINGALGFYIDQSYEIAKNRIGFRKSRKTMIKEMDQIVADAIKFYRYREIVDFNGFSEQVSDKIAAIESLKLSQSIPDGSSAIGSMQKDQVARMKIEELKSLTFLEVGAFSGENLMVMTESSVESIDQATQEALLLELSEFKTHDELNTMQFDLSNASITLLASEDEFVLPDYQAVAEPQDDFAKQVLAMLEENQQEMRTMRGEIDQIRLQQEREREQTETNFSVQKQIDELREMIVMLVQGEVAGIDPIIKEQPPRPRIANLPPKVTLTFASGSTIINGAGQLIVSEIIDLLAHHPEMKVMITGYADLQGDPAKNLLISQKRAKGVRKIVAQRGIANERLIMNYFGDSQASSISQSERKVVIEFLY